MSDTASNRYDSWLIIAIGLLQGCALAVLVWLEKSATLQPWLQYSLWGWTLLVPPTAQWLIAHRRQRGYWVLLVVVAALVPAVCWEPRSAVLPELRDQGSSTLFVGGILAWAALVSLASALLRGGGIRDYPSLFRLTCRTLLLPAGALLFTLMFGLLLWLWGALFNVIGVRFFQTLFQSDWFIWPVHGIAFAIATAILIDRPALVDGVRRAGTAIAAALLPVIVIIHLLFLGGLVVVGLDLLWATRHATPLVLTLLIFFLVLLNGAHEEGTKLDCLPRLAAGFVRLAILLSPIYVAIAAYSLWLRVAQYGWSPDRVVSACVITFIGLLVLAYVVQTVRKPLFILPRLAMANAGALAALVIVGVAVNSPLLSPKRIAAASQEHRILSGRDTPTSNDWDNLAFNLGRYGRDALSRLATGARDDETRKAATAALAVSPGDRYAYRRSSVSPQAMTAKNFSVIPGDLPAPAELVEVLRTRLAWSISSCTDSCKLLAIDITRDGEPEMVLLGGNLPVFRRHEGRWIYFGRLAKPDDLPAFDPEQSGLIAGLRDGKAKTVPAEWLDVEVDGVRLRLK